MTASLKSRESKRVGLWADAIAQPAQEFPLTPLPVLEGAIPSGLQGSLFRNGPGRLTRGAESVGHWFDGDGGILAVHFGAAQAQATYRYVQTAGYLADEQSGRFEGSGYGMHASGSYFKRWRAPLKNAANTSVLALPDKLLALWEGGQPHALDLETLETVGLDDLGGLQGNLPYSAHPKRDPKTGDIYNFGVTLGRQTQLQLYRSDRSGAIQQQNAIPLDAAFMIHDFVLAGAYLVFCISPVRLNVLPVLLHLQSFSDGLVWNPERGTQILIVDRETLSLVKRIDAEPWYQWHFGNGFVNTTGEIVLNLVRYEDFQTNQFLKEVATGRTHTKAVGRLWELRLNPRSGQIVESGFVSDRSCEFPVVDPNLVGQPSRFTYLSMRGPDADIGRELFGAIARYDAQAQELTVADCGDAHYSMEPIYAPDAYDAEQGWIVTVVFDSDRTSSEVWIYDGNHFGESPVCRLALPHVIPFGFHGTWKPKV
jgi:all-trans-8'-apo-beta-carotenal 15,15'-oxygenase